MTTGADIAATARSYLGIKFAHAGRLPGAHLDCIGILTGIAQEHGFVCNDDATYPARPDGEILLRELARSMDQIPIEEAGVGDVVALWIHKKDRPQHAGVLSEYGIIHTHSGVGKVAEHVLNDQWRKRIHSAWRFRRAD